ncbi:MAG: NAD(P)-binding domain-containing protein [Blastocatellia bacterium]
MKKSQVIVTFLILVVLLVTGLAAKTPLTYGGAPWFGWLLAPGALLALALGFVVVDGSRRRARVLAAAQAAPAAGKPKSQTTLFRATHDKLPEWVRPIAAQDEVRYPHPVINTATCIGFHACVDACPHDVLAIVNGKSTPIAVEQCMEDTSCQVECPTNPKSCIVLNTNKKIPERKVPKRDQKFMTDVPGVFLIGDVSGVPLIKNAINEGGAVMDHVADELQREGHAGAADYDVAIVGVGPAGLSAAVRAGQRGLKYVAIEQDQVVATIQQTYPAGKYVFFNPADKPTTGGISLAGAGASKEDMVGSWLQSMNENKIAINEYESCKSVKSDGGVFVVTTEQDKTKEKQEYRTRKVILAIGNRGTPAKLRVQGEDLKIRVTPAEPRFPRHCNKCGTRRQADNTFCHECGNKYITHIPEPFDDDKVKFKLADPDQFRGKHCVVVGAGNSAIEAAVDLAAYRDKGGTNVIGYRDNVVTLVIRSDFKSDLKLGNKMMAWHCIDEGKIKVFFGATIREITPGEVALMSARDKDPKTAKDLARFKNDYIFALIGGEKPTKFLEGIGVKIG